MEKNTVIKQLKETLRETEQQNTFLKERVDMLEKSNEEHTQYYLRQIDDLRSQLKKAFKTA